MERQLRGWLRYCVYFGIYVGVYEDTSATTISETGGDTNNKIALCAIQRCHGQRPQWYRGQQNNKIFRQQRLYLWFLTLVLYTVYFLGLYTRSSYPGISWVAATILFTVHVLTMTLLMREAWCKQAQHDLFLQILEEIETALRLRLRHNVQSAQLLCDLRRLIVYLSVISALGFALFALTTMWLSYVDYFWFGFWLIIIIRVRVIQLIVYLCILRHFLRCLCAQLRLIVAYHTARGQTILDVDGVHLRSLKCLLAVKEIYELLHREFQLLNEFAGWSLFTSISSYLLDAICTLYWMLLSLDGFVRRRNYEIAGIFVLLPLALFLWYLMFLCDNCKQLVSW